MLRGVLALVLGALAVIAASGRQLQQTGVNFDLSESLQEQGLVSKLCNIAEIAVRVGGGGMNLASMIHMLSKWTTGVSTPVL